MKPSEKLWILSHMSDFLNVSSGCYMYTVAVATIEFSHNILKAGKAKIKSQNQNRAMGRTDSHCTLSDSASITMQKPHS